jgi:mxaJ protein
MSLTSPTTTGKAMFVRRKTILLGVSAMAAAVAAATPASAWEMRVCADFNRLPLSNEAGEGYENRIAAIIADELGATLVFEHWPARDVLVTNALRPGDCDVIIGAGDDGTTLNTLAYYRSPFVFVYRADEDYDIFTFDDPILRELRLGVQPTFGPTHQALMRRDLGEAIEEFNYVGGAEHPLAPAIEAVANNEIDVAIVWGPAAGYYAARQDVALVVQPVPPFDPPFTPMYVNISIGVRLGDESLRDAIDIALTNRWDDIYAVLEEYNIPTMPLPQPTLTIEVP